MKLGHSLCHFFCGRTIQKLVELKQTQGELEHLSKKKAESIVEI